MTQQTCPYTAWVLQPSFKPKEATFTRHVTSMGEHYGSEANTGKWYRSKEIFPTKEDAIFAGRLRIDQLQADIDKRITNLNKKKAALDKAEST